MNLTESQVYAVIEWMNTWEQLKDTVIPIRFKEDFINKHTTKPSELMHFSYVESGDNFVPDKVTDPFRRIPIKYGVTLELCGSREAAELKIKHAIEDYIQKNTVASHNHIEEKYIPEELLPEIQLQRDEPREQTLEEQIRSCTELPVLKAYQLLVKKDPILQQAYNETMDKIKSHA